jgi:hypothetical protein
MGWTGMSPRYDGDRKKWLEDQFTGEHSHLSDLSIKGSTAYGIYWWNDGNSTKHEAIVILISCRKDEWAYKDMGESALPYYFDAPKKLLDRLDKLGEPFNDNARQWRARCRENLSTKYEAIPSGALVKFARELDFRSFKADTFTLAKDGRKTFFYAPNGTKCLIPKWQTRDHQIINH